MDDEYERSVTKSQPPLAAQLQDLALEIDSVESFLQHLVDVAVGAINDDISAGLTMVRDGLPATVASSDADARRYDEVQYMHDQGPCLSAMRTGQEILVTNLEHEDRFGDYRAHALESGQRSSFSLPIDGGQHAVGALNLYSRVPETFGPAERKEGRQFAAEATRALQLAMRLARNVEVTEQLQTALTSRAVIDQAIGVLMAQNRCGSEQAFAILRTASQHRNIKLRILASEIVAGVSDATK